MNIANSFDAGKHHNKKTLLASSIWDGNIIPSWWYQIFKTKADIPKPDLISHCILADLLSSYLANGQTYFQKDYYYFQSNYGISYAQAGKAFERLEKFGVMKRQMDCVVFCQL